MAQNPQEIIEAALRIIGALDTGETPPNDIITDSYAILEQMIELWTIERLFKYRRELIGPFNTANATANYSIATGQTWNSARPIRITGGFIKVTNIDYQLEIITARKYDGHLAKATAGRPTELFYDPAYPTGTVYLYPTPTAAEAVYLRVEKSFLTLSNLTTDMVVPPEYLIPIKWNLALELAAEYGSKRIEMIAAKAKADKDALKIFHGLPTDKDTREAAAPEDVQG